MDRKGNLRFFTFQFKVNIKERNYNMNKACFIYQT